MRTVLIVDSDLGFVFWLGRTLERRAGYEAFPARTVADAITLFSDRIPQLDLLIINLSLKGATKFVKAVRQARERVEVIPLEDGLKSLTEELPWVEALIARAKEEGNPGIRKLSGGGETQP